MKNELKSTKDKILLLKNQLEVLGINKKSASSSTNVDTRAFKATIEFYRDEIFVLENDKEIHKALNVMITLYDYYYNSNITTSIEDNNYLAVITKKNDYVDELKYFVTYTLQHLRATTKVNEFRI